MARTIGMAEAKSKLSDLVGQVAYGGQEFVLERRGRPMAVLISLDEYRRWQELEQAARRQPLSPELRQRQEGLVSQAHRLRARLGDPVKGLADLMSSLPAEGEEFWLQLAEGTP
jgi:prevent-host-death family protein